MVCQRGRTWGVRVCPFEEARLGMVRAVAWRELDRIGMSHGLGGCRAAKSVEGYESGVGRAVDAAERGLARCVAWDEATRVGTSPGATKGEPDCRVTWVGGTWIVERTSTDRQHGSIRGESGWLVTRACQTGLEWCVLSVGPKRRGTEPHVVLVGRSVL